MMVVKSQRGANTVHDGGAAGRSRRELNPALAPTFRHPLWGPPQYTGRRLA